MHKPDCQPVALYYSVHPYTNTIAHVDTTLTTPPIQQQPGPQDAPAPALTRCIERRVWWFPSVRGQPEHGEAWRDGDSCALDPAVREREVIPSSMQVV